MKKIILALCVMLMCVSVFAAPKPSYPDPAVSYGFSEAFTDFNLSDSAYQLIFDGLTNSTSYVQISNGGSNSVVVATGSAATKTVQFLVPAGASNLVLPVKFQKGQNIWIKGHSGANTTGSFLMNLFH